MSQTATTTPSRATSGDVDGTGTRVGPWVRRVFVANLVVEVGIIVTGGLVRLTGSGLGCPTWPQCVPGSYTPIREQATSYHPWIEFGNRLLAFLVVAAALALIWVVVIRLRHRRGFLAPALLLLLGILAQALIGGISVRMDLAPMVVQGHFLVSAALVALSTYLLVRLGEGDGPPTAVVPRLVRNVAWLTAAVGAVVLTLGTVVTGSGPHSGDAETPARLSFDPRTISWLHADSVMLFIGLAVAVWLAVRLTAHWAGSRPDPHLGHQEHGHLDRARQAWGLVLLVTLAQGAVGYTQYLTGLPQALVLAHMLFAALLVAALTNGVLSLRRR